VVSSRPIIADQLQHCSLLLVRCAGRNRTYHFILVYLRAATAETRLINSPFRDVTSLRSIVLGTMGGYTQRYISGAGGLREGYISAQDLNSGSARPLNYISNRRPMPWGANSGF